MLDFISTLSKHIEKGEGDAARNILFEPVIDHIPRYLGMAVADVSRAGIQGVTR